MKATSTGIASTRAPASATASRSPAQAKTAALGDPLLRVLDRDGNELAANDDSEGARTPRSNSRRSASGDVFIEARGFADALHRRLHAERRRRARCRRDDISADRNTRGRINVGQSVEGALDFAGDPDWYRVRLRRRPILSLHASTAPATRRSAIRCCALTTPTAKNSPSTTTAATGSTRTSNSPRPRPATTSSKRAPSPTAAPAATRSARSPATFRRRDDRRSLSADGDYREGVLSPAGDRDWYRVDLAEGQAHAHRR